MDKETMRLLMDSRREISFQSEDGWTYTYSDVTERWYQSRLLAELPLEVKQETQKIINEAFGN